MAVTCNKTGLLAGKVAIVTGASRGIGDAIAVRYAMEGASVVVSARTVESGDHPFPGSMNEVVQRIRDAGGEATAIRADLAVDEHRENLIKSAVALYGDVDILVNNAAVTYFMPVESFTRKHYRLMLEVLVDAPFHLSQLVLPAMKSRGSGRILNISSRAALHPSRDEGIRGGTVYGMCKTALERFTTGLASEVYEDGIAVNVISPGLVATPGVMHHKLINDSNRHRVMPVEYMAEACLFLVCGDRKEMTGMVTYADEIIRDYELKPAELIA